MKDESKTQELREKREAFASNYNGHAIADKPVKITMKDWSMIVASFFFACKYTKSIATRTIDPAKCDVQLHRQLNTVYIRPKYMTAINKKTKTILSSI